jgi:hypothetical protein
MAKRIATTGDLTPRQRKRRAVVMRNESHAERSHLMKPFLSIFGERSGLDSPLADLPVIFKDGVSSREYRCVGDARYGLGGEAQ